DLLFFKTGIVTRHVGIYIEDGLFLHASSSRGVIISRLSNNYWRDTYWKAKRI
ncbi:MAG: C40 family peptidase, partial [Desulfamplus sp.]|nr:C40 family peptidase [Desulfamplus sp.]